jgi:hypothetical protein
MAERDVCFTDRFRTLGPVPRVNETAAHVFGRADVDADVIAHASKDGRGSFPNGHLQNAAIGIPDAVLSEMGLQLIEKVYAFVSNLIARLRWGANQL